LRTDVEIRLRRAGVVVDSTEPTYLYVNVNALRSSLGGCVYAILVKFEQPAFLPSGRTVIAATWDSGTLGTTPQTDGRHIRDVLGDLVDQFVNDWLSANPPKPRQDANK
jgi:hypothetical protein